MADIIQNNQINNSTNPVPPPPIANQPIAPAPTHSPKRKLLLAIAGVIVFIIIVVSAIFLVGNSNKQKQSQQTIQPIPTETIPPDLLAVVGGERRIYKSTVERAALKKYKQTAITPDILKQYYEVVIEQAILDYEAKTSGLLTTTTNNTPTPTGKVIKTDYELIKNQIKDKYITYREGYMIGYWLPTTSESTPTIETQRQQGPQILNEAAAQLKQSTKPSVVASQIYAKYPLIQSILAVNGYMYSFNRTQLNLFDTPKKFYEDETSAYSKVFINTLFGMQENEAKVIINPEAGADAIFLQKIHQGQYKSYTDFITQKKKELVKTYNTL